MIDSIDRALEILLLFRQTEKEMSVTEISKLLGFHKSTVCRTLETLANRGFVRQNTENSKYWLGLQLYSLGMAFRDKEPLKKLAYPYAKKLAEEFKEGVHILTLAQNTDGYPKHIVLEKVQSRQVLNLAPPVGSIGACHSSASGKCLLAYSKPEYLRNFVDCDLPMYTKNTIGTWDKLMVELDAIRQQGYAVDREELEIGLICIAAPIFDQDGRITAAISLSGPVSRISEAVLPAIISEVKHTAAEISSLL